MTFIKITRFKTGIHITQIISILVYELMWDVKLQCIYRTWTYCFSYIV